MHFEGCKKKNSGSNLSNGAPSLREIWKFVGTDLENLGGGVLALRVLLAVNAWGLRR